MTEPRSSFFLAHDPRPTTHDHVLLIGFGAPETAADVGPYLERFAATLGIPRARLVEVEKHYAAIGGASPYNAEVQRFYEVLNSRLEAAGGPRLFVGMKNWKPYLDQTLCEVAARGLKRGLGVVLAPQRSPASFEAYTRAVDAAVAAAGGGISYEYMGPWHEDSHFITAQADALKPLWGVNPISTQVLFSAHAIPMSLAERSRYREEVSETAVAVARASGIREARVVFQSRSGHGEPWTEPNALDAVREAAAAGKRRVVFCPVGFVCENAEILYDLDVEAAAEAKKCGMGYARARTVLSEPRVVGMFVDRILGHGRA